MSTRRKYHNCCGVAVYKCQAFTIMYKLQPASWNDLSPQEVLLNIDIKNIKVKLHHLQMIGDQWRLSENEIHYSASEPIGDPLFDNIPLKRLTYGELKRVFLEVVINGRLPEKVYQECINRRLGLLD